MESKCEGETKESHGVLNPIVAFGLWMKPNPTEGRSLAKQPKISQKNSGKGKQDQCCDSFVLTPESIKVTGSSPDKALHLGVGNVEKSKSMLYYVIDTSDYIRKVTISKRHYL